MTIGPEELGGRIRLAREASRLKQEDVARHLGVSRSTIAQMELGNRAVTSLELDRLARLYNRDIRDLLAEVNASRTPGRDEDSLLMLFRRDPDVSGDQEVVEALGRCLALGREMTGLERLLGIERELMATVVYVLPVPRTKWEAVRQGERIASKERGRLGLGDARVPSITEMLSAQGVRTAELDLPADISGLTLVEPGTGILVVVNRRHPFARRRFSYAHEYCHVLLDREEKGSISRGSRREDLLEVRANACAASFLMPVEGTRGFIRGLAKGHPSRRQASVFDEEAVVAAEARASPGSQSIQMHDVVLLAHHFGVSRPSALFRLRNLRLATATEFESLRRQEERGLGRELSRFLGLTERDREESQGEFRHRFLGLGLEAFRRGDITRAKLFELAGMVGESKRELRRILEASGFTGPADSARVRREVKDAAGRC